jgi:hypothetical protein
MRPATVAGGFFLFELFLRARTETSNQVSRKIFTPEIVRVGVAFRAQRLQLLAPLFDQLVVFFHVSGCGRGRCP